MFKVIYWSKKKNKLLVVMFFDYDNLMYYLKENEDDFELKNHFIKVVMEDN